MKSFCNRLVAITAFFGLFSATAHADLIIAEFTGDDLEMQFSFADLADGSVQIDVSITPTSAETGDIRAVWLGIDDALFDASLILTGDVTVTPGDFSLTNPAVVDLGGGDNLNGGDGIYFDFDLDIALQQDLNPDQSITALVINISTSGLLASYFNEGGARVRSSTGPDGSSKLIGGEIVKVPEPPMITLLGMGLLAFGFARRGEIAAQLKS